MDVVYNFLQGYLDFKKGEQSRHRMGKERFFFFGQDFYVSDFPRVVDH